MAFLIILSIAAVMLIGLAIYIAWGLRFLAKVDAMERQLAQFRNNLWMAKWPEEYIRFVANHDPL